MINIKTDQANLILQKLDAMAEDMTDLKLSTARLEEKLNTIDVKFTEQFKGVDIKFEGVDTKFEGVDTKLTGIGERLTAQEERSKSLDRRLWGFISGLVIVLLGTLTKLLFFPSQV